MSVYEIRSITDTLRGNRYPGRGIVIGKSADGKHAVFAYFIMGRSENSRNRIFEEQGEELLIRPYDVSQVKDPSLILYTPVRKMGDWLIVTNGDQTDTIRDYLQTGGCFEGALETREHEPDAPNFTPRISGILWFAEDDFIYKLSILKSADEWGSACCRQTFAYPALPGLGHLIHTYVEDGTPLPSFQGEPKRVAIPDDIESFTNDLWDILDTENKISLYVRYIDFSDGKSESRLKNVHP
jgi:IMP cyclohydrolase